MLRSEKVKHLQVIDPHPHSGLSWGNRGLEERRGLLEVTEGVGLGLGRGGPAPRCPESVGPAWAPGLGNQQPQCSPPWQELGIL